jgi:hypothetical protein
VFTRELALEVSTSGGGGGGAPPIHARPASAARRLTVQAWDVGGRASADLLGRAFWAGAGAAVVCYDPRARGGAGEVVAGLDHWLGVLEARAAIAGRRPPVVVLAIVKGGGPPPPAAVLAAARRWCAARARAPHFVTEGGCGGGALPPASPFTAAVEAAARAGLVYAEGRAGYWGAGDGKGAADAALAGLSAVAG